jgi:hypothetical protein
MLTTINCGDDTDCTAATVGATLGILGGMATVPADWQQHVGDEIVTISINRSDNRSGAAVPKSCTELTERVVRQAPYTLFANHQGVSLVEGSEEIPADTKEKLLALCPKQLQETILTPFTAHYESASLCADVTLCGGCDIAPLEEKIVTVSVYSRPELGDEPMNITHRWWLSDGFSVRGKQTSFVCRQCTCYTGKAELHFTLTAGETVAPTNRLVLELMPEGRSTPLYIPVVLLG